MTVLSKLTFVEIKLMSRDVGSLIFGLFFPAVLLLILGFIPGFSDPDPELGGSSLIELYTPIILVLTFAMVGVSSLAVFLSTYRSEGVLRRLRVTPVGPHRLLIAQLAAHLALALLGSALAMATAMLVFDISAPASWLGVILGLALAGASLFAVGLLLGAIAPSPSAAGTLGPLVWLPLMVFAGLWFPREAMPDLMRRISDLSPGGAAVDAIQQAWFSGTVDAGSLAVMAVTLVVVGMVAAAVFRWE